jgi:type II secretory pathway pseudopilin PulG
MTVRHSRPAFTLIEILIVIGLIVLIIALAVPAFSFITGSRSVDAGENLVSGMLSLARATAIASDGSKSALMFFRDPTNERTAMALIVLPADPGLYKSWRQFQEDGTTPTTYYVGNEVYRLVDSGPAGKQVNKKFRCIQQTTAGSPGPPNQTSPAGNSNAFWAPVSETIFEVGEGFEVRQIQYLPPGVSAQLVNDPDPDSVRYPITPPGAGRDRYVRIGLILFDSSGALLHQQYKIYGTSQPYQMTYQTGQPPPIAPDLGDNANYPLFSQMGVVLYDEENFRTAGGTEKDAVNNNVNYNSGGPGNADYNEPVEEAWLDGYPPPGSPPGTPPPPSSPVSLMINRYNGTLIRGE